MRLYTAVELAKLLKVHVKTIYKLGREGKIARVKVGRSVRFVMPGTEE
jgi:excisionase family DNA binding protein